jgi:hypothetical protein
LEFLLQTLAHPLLPLGQDFLLDLRQRAELFLLVVHGARALVWLLLISEEEPEHLYYGGSVKMRPSSQIFFN